MPASPLVVSLKNSNPPTPSIFQPPNLKSDDKNEEQQQQEEQGGEQAQPQTPALTTQPQKQGRRYSPKYALKPGGIHVDDMIFGVSMAHLSCTDDSEKRLLKSSPNTLTALGLIAGGLDQTHKPLSELLKNKFNLQFDTWINQSGFFRGRPVDTQGFIASNDTTIVLSYRFSTSIKDWMTNLSMTSSEWEPHKDELTGMGAGDCSCLQGWWTKLFEPTRAKPRVHTGFYNNFVYTIPYLRDYILSPLLKPGATPKKVYVCGCSLGAAIATMSFCWLLEELEDKLSDPSFVHHKLINVTAGCPRCVDPLMKAKTMAIIDKLRPLDRAVSCRLVYNHDLVPHIPFKITSEGLVHLDKLVYITVEGEVWINPRLEHSSSFGEVKDVFNNFFKSVEKIRRAKKAQEEQEESNPQANDETAIQKTAFEIELENTPGPIKDHMPYWYLTLLEKLKQRVDTGEA